MQREAIEDLIYGGTNQRRRFTQDFPVLPDVWIGYGMEPRKRLELLLTPHTRSDAPSLSRALRARLDSEEAVARKLNRRTDKDRIDVSKEKAYILFNESVVLAYLSFAELIRVALPLTDWWARVIAPIKLSWSPEALASAVGSPEFDDQKSAGGDLSLLKKLIVLVGTCECARRRLRGGLKNSGDAPSKIQIRAFADLVEGLTMHPAKGGLLWGVSRNRPAYTSIWRSRKTVKADAASRLFSVDTSEICWAVLDTGIDARHPAFLKRNRDGTAATEEERDEKGNRQFPSRVTRTYDFLRIKNLLNPAHPVDVKNTAANDLGAKQCAVLSKDLKHSLKFGRAIEWDLLEPFLRIPHTRKNYVPPTDPHGSHVAGILAANWPEARSGASGEAPMIGMCPDLELYDLRVLGSNADEFTIIAALQFVRHLNAHRDLIAIHGVNLSMSVPHDVANYACGRTPVCEECERAVANGVVVVTAAGNRGFNKLAQPEGGATGDYRYISITDPGNSESVITVGSTHRFMPHNYGVSYFSSRGPTGDGRTKPDLVAPGERIDSCAPNGRYATMDGTSMAAPHVSGAAALLIGRHRELIGQPKSVKEILCKSATDLGREPHFQGAGMVDVLRALQSV
jgi:serine protease AprX